LLERKNPANGSDRSLIQKLNFDTNTLNPDAYDFMDFLEKNYTEEDYLPIKSFSGVSIYLPINQDPIQAYYNMLNWSKDANWISLFH